MAIETYAIKCPGCGASIQLPEGRKTGYCNYCGTQIAIESTNEHITRHIDEAKLKRAETEAIVRLKELEMEQRRIAREERKEFFKTALAALLIFFTLGCFLVQIFVQQARIYFLLSGITSILVLKSMFASNDQNGQDKKQ
jgi:DNA-directed RNA polymerase subunit RPC12/RpoP